MFSSGRIDSDPAAMQALHEQYGWVPGSSSIRPRPDVIAEKDAYRDNADSFYSSDADAVLDLVFDYPTTFGADGKLSVAADAVLANPKRVFAPNKFAYAVPEGTNHSVLWYAGGGHNTGGGGGSGSSQPGGAAVSQKEKEEEEQEQEGKVNRDLASALGQGTEFAWYSNPKPTIAHDGEDSRLWHVQVFWHRTTTPTPTPTTTTTTTTIAAAAAAAASPGQQEQGQQRQEQQQEQPPVVRVTGSGEAERGPLSPPATSVAGGTKECTAGDRGPLLMRLGCIADVQYADADDGSNFKKDVTRRYRHSLIAMRRAVSHWNGAGVGCVLQLGDFIDGLNSDKGSSEAAMAEVLEVVSCSSGGAGGGSGGSGYKDRWIHCIGNHEMYNFGRDRLHELLHTRPPAQPPPSTAAAGGGSSCRKFPAFSATGREYYSFKPCQGWTVIVMDPYEVSLIGSSDMPGSGGGREQALEWLRANNPNDVLASADWVAGLDGLQKRWVPYNGGVSQEQLAWLRHTLAGVEAAEEERLRQLAGRPGSSGPPPERVIVMSHVGFYPGCIAQSCILWNFEEVIAALHDFSRLGIVAAVLHGHDHKGGRAVDEHGILHLTFPSALEVDVGEDCFGVLDLYAGSFELQGYGAVLNGVLGQEPGTPLIWPVEKGTRFATHSDSVDEFVDEFQSRSSACGKPIQSKA